MTKATAEALERAQAIRSHLENSEWRQCWDRCFLEDGRNLDAEIEERLINKIDEVDALVDAALSPRLPLLLKPNTDDHFFLVLAAVRCCLEAAAFLEPLETALFATESLNLR